MLLSYLNELLNGNYIKLVIVWQLQNIVVCLRQCTKLPRIVASLLQRDKRLSRDISLLPVSI
jgi:hypothetical protein